jgi:uncharacterized membrane protein
VATGGGAHERRVTLAAAFLVFLQITTLIAGIGVLLDQPILIVGAMVVGPEFGPIAGLCVALVLRERTLAMRSPRALVIGLPRRSALR